MSSGVVLSSVCSTKKESEGNVVGGGSYKECRMAPLAYRSIEKRSATSPDFLHVRKSVIEIDHEVVREEQLKFQSFARFLECFRDMIDVAAARRTSAHQLMKCLSIKHKLAAFLDRYMTIG